MSAFIALLKELQFRIKLYFKGVRFNERHSSDDPLIQSVLLHIDDLYEIVFYCYRKPCSNRLLKLGRLTTETYNSYLVRAEFSDTAPKVFQDIKEKTLYFSGRLNRFSDDESVTLSLIVDIYLDFLKLKLQDATFNLAVEKEVNETWPVGL